MSDNQDHDTTMFAIGLAAKVLAPHTEWLAILDAAERKMHSSLHITDPTLYRDAINSDGVRQQIELARAALAFLAVVEKVETEIKGDAA